jgi:histidinol-phosphate aminotransferase
VTLRYQKPAELYDGLRLHQNEHTGGCSPKVLAALAALRPEQVSVYPPYEAATRDCADYLGVDPAQVSLVNGLDKGIMAAAVAFLRPPPGDRPGAEAVIPVPAFEILEIDTEAAGGVVVQVPPGPAYAFPLDDVLAAVTERTRVVFITSPNNPTGALASDDAIAAVAERLPDGAIVFVDEAYAEFSGTSFIPRLASHRNVVVGRTFSKAFGLAGLRIGALVGHPDTLEPIRLLLPVYSVNIAAVVALQAALQDRAYVDAYLAEVRESRALLYTFCERHGFGSWPSAGNFVLIDAGARASLLARGASDRGVYVRDRSSEPWLTGCLRVGAGVVAHTTRCIEVFEEVLCAAR